MSNCECDVLDYCPFDANGGLDCYNHCGLGADPSEPDIDLDEEEEDDCSFYEDVDESMNPYDGTYDWENDNSMIGEEW